ncbi:ABI3 protein, partial [Sterrhoptilus dennistouni]|nr:ABI3 protein [Sterrhoptilus dennistouni]
QAEDKRKALEETMALSTQSLASVTYQVSSVAGALLRLLELQAAQLRRLEADVTHLGQSVDIHQEKVSRRAIGALAVPRRVPSCPQVVPPLEPPVLEPYYRRPLDLGALDHVGHGVKDTSTRLSRTGTLARKSTKSSSAPPGGTLGRGGRVPEPVQPPVVPQGKFPGPPGSSEPETPSSSGAPAAPGEGIPAPPPLPGPPGLALSPPRPLSPPGPLSPLGPPPAIPAPPPLPGDILPPLPGDILPPPGGFAAPDDLELLPPPPEVPEFGDMALPGPPAGPEFGDTALPGPPAPEEPP